MRTQIWTSSARPAGDYVRFRWLLMALTSSPPTQWAMPTPTPVLKPNAKYSNVGGDFPHMFDIWSGGARVLVFTDKEQDTPQVVEITARTLVNAAITADQITSLGESRDDGASFPGAYDDDNNDASPAIEGTFKCTGDSCSLDYTGRGDDVMVTTATGYTFSGSREAVTAVEADAKEDYLLFGVWLDEVAEGDDAGADTFGAIATGGQPFTANNVEALEGKATYRGSAVGAHHKTGSGVSSFDGDANLTADFKNAGTAGTIEGTIDNISVDGGDPMEDSIHLVQADLTTGATLNTFNGRAVMGQQLGPGLMTHTFNGTWSGGFFGNGEKMTDHPGSVAGTFGVTNTTGTGDDAVTESYVGAFGAHRKVVAKREDWEGGRMAALFFVRREERPAPRSRRSRVVLRKLHPPTPRWSGLVPFKMPCLLDFRFRKECRSHEVKVTHPIARYADEFMVNLR